MVTLSKDLTGIAGVHWVVSKLSIRGMVAMPTIRNTAGIDILVSSKDGKKMAFLQVKTSANKVKFWSTPEHDKILDGKNCYYVFLRYIESEENFQTFMVSGAEVKKQVNETPITTARREGKNSLISNYTKKMKLLIGETGLSLLSESKSI